jgi:AbrB family looped-hinge helix DNA binding protein
MLYLSYLNRIDMMATVTVSPKFQVVIPRDVREELGIEVGQKIQVIALDNRLEMIPVRTAKSMRGFLKGFDTQIERDADRV